MGNRPMMAMRPLQHLTTSSASFPPSLLRECWAKMKGMNPRDWIDMFFPCCRWIRTYKWIEYLPSDLVAGCTVGIMILPHAMCYANLAGLKAIYGLYAAMMAVSVYAIFGSSPQLAVGPVAMVSLLVSTALSEIVDQSDELYTELAILLALMVGVLECVMGLFRLGWVFRFISHSVISGFTTASALVIALSQAEYVLGYQIKQSSKIVPLIKSIISGFDKFSWPPFVMGSCILTVLLIMKYLAKTRTHLHFLRAAGPLTAVVLGLALVIRFKPSSVSVVGEIPRGLPPFYLPKGLSYVKSLIPTALHITGVAILESVGIAKALAAKENHRLDPNQELFGLGLANIIGSFFSAYPITGSLCRSAVNYESGAKTGLAGIATGLLIVFSLLVLTPLLHYIPQCALAAIVFSAVIGLVDYKEAILLWCKDKKDFALWAITVLTTLFLGIDIGVLIGVGVSLSLVIHESTKPRIAVLGCIPGSTSYRDVKQCQEAQCFNGITIARVYAPLTFANIGCIIDKLLKYAADCDGSPSNGPQVGMVSSVILDMSAVTYIDSRAARSLEVLFNKTQSQSQKMQFVIADPTGEARLILTEAKLFDLIGEEWYFTNVHEAVQACRQHGQSVWIQTGDDSVLECSDSEIKVPLLLK